MKRIFINSKHHFQILQKNENSLLTNRYRCVIIIKRAREREIWRNSSAGQSNRFIPDRSWVRIQLPLPIIAVTTRQWPVGQAAKTPPFHGGNTSSILVRVTKRNKSELFRKSKLVRICFLLLNSYNDAVSERGQATSLFSFLSASCCAFHSANSLCPCSDSK